MERDAVNNDPSVVYSTLNVIVQFVVAVMFAFLNPPKVRKIFIDESDSIKESSAGNGAGKKRKKKPLEYVVHVPDKKAMERYVRTEGKDFVRYANVWSVIGHFRHYQNGRIIFINPYEKGRDRNKGLLDESRDRVVKRVHVDNVENIQN